MDRVLGKVGLHGKSFIPLLSSFACAIPGIMATRTIESRNDRLATIFVAPFMSCSARLPVYALLIGAFFSGYGALAKGGILLSLYVLGILAAVVTAWFFKRTMLKGPASAFILELPTYKVPQVSQVARQVWTNTAKFLTKAGTIIFALSIVLWALMYYPRLPDAQKAQIRAGVTPTENAIRYALTPPPPEDASGLLWIGQARAAYGSEGLTHFTRDDGSRVSALDSTGEIVRGALTAQERERLDVYLGAEAEKKIKGEELRHSIAGRFGHFIEPVIRPLGYDWKMGVGLVGAFAAREVFVSTMGIVYSVGDASEETADLEAAMAADRYADGTPVWTPAVAASLLVFFVLAMQCASTLAIVRRETGGWRWPLFMLAYMNALAYVVALVVYQVGRLIT
jgi:ferrous iron transport protein B